MTESKADFLARLDGRRRHLALTYVHFGLAMFVVLAAEIALFSSGVAARVAPLMLGVNWLFFLAGFLVIGWIARHFAHRVRTQRAQYFGLILYAAAQTIILMPLLYLAEQSAPGAIVSAGWLTAVAAVSLSAIALLSGKDFSFLRGLLYWGGTLALTLIVLAWLTPIRLGLWFSGAMIGLAGASVLSDTSRMLRRRRYKGRHVANALELFASVAMMFWYALRLFRRLDLR